MRFRTLLVLLCLAGLIGAARATEPKDCQIVIGSSHRPPLSNTAVGQGILDTLVIEMFRRIDRTACIIPLPAERSLINADGGLIDGDILRVRGIVNDPRYPHLERVPEVLYLLPMMAFTRRTDLEPRSLADLAPLRVGFVVGWKILEEQVKAAEITRARGAEELFALLREDKVDLVIYERLTGQHLVKRLGIKGVRAIEPPLLVTPQFLVLHRRHQALLEPLAHALRALKAEGAYERAFGASGVRAPR